jgi:multicomponent Na+:H+ antiporter subunit E
MNKHAPSSAEIPAQAYQVIRTKSQTSNQQLLILLLVNLGLAVIWHVFMQAWGAADYLIGFAIGALVLSVYEREYGRRLKALLSFFVYVSWQIILSNINVAWVIVQPNPNIRPAIVGVPLTVTNNLEIIVLATVITLTPGTVSIDLAYDDEGKRVLYVHSFVVDDPDAFRSSIKETFEHRLLLITRGEVA